MQAYNSPYISVVDPLTNICTKYFCYICYLRRLTHFLLYRFKVDIFFQRCSRRWRVLVMWPFKLATWHWFSLEETTYAFILKLALAAQSQNITFIISLSYKKWPVTIVDCNVENHSIFKCAFFVSFLLLVIWGWGTEATTFTQLRLSRYTSLADRMRSRSSQRPFSTKWFPAVFDVTAVHSYHVLRGLRYEEASGARTIPAHAFLPRL